MARYEFTRSDILQHACAIREEYEKDGMTLTLRQMYYQFVSRGLIPSGQEHYKRIGDVLTEARYNGDFPIDGLEDRGREVVEGDVTDHDVDVDVALDKATDAIGNLKYFIRSDRWFRQPTVVSVWVEKQALEGVFAPICDDLGVPFFACKGYPSVSALWDWIKLMERATDAEECVVLYFGDHDPDGWEIPRSAERNIARLVETYDPAIPKVTFKRIGLTMEQIKRYNPPPFDAKVTSARYQGYIQEHNTQDAWELDALEPKVLRDLIKKNVESYFDREVAKENAEEVKEARREFVERMDPEWFKEAAGIED